MKLRNSRQDRFAFSVLTKLFVCAIAASAVQIAAAEPCDPDEGAGGESIQLIARLTPTAVGAFAAGPGDLHRANVDELLAAAGVQEVTAALGFAAKDDELAAELGLDRYRILSLRSDVKAQGAIDHLLLSEGFFESVQINSTGSPAGTIPNDPAFDLLWGMKNSGQAVGGSESGTPGADIDASNAWYLSTGSEEIVLAVLDSGVDPHVDFGGKLVSGWNTRQNNTNTSDSCPHGTHVAGIAGAIGDNGVGVAGVDWNARIMPVRVINCCAGQEALLAAGLIWAADHGARVGNMSLQYRGGSDLLYAAVEYAYQSGMLLIAASGNHRGNEVAFPARFDHVMAVGATDNNDGHPSFSNFGPEVDIAAPGKDIFSTLGVDQYRIMSGTSMATAHVSGLATLILSVDDELRNDQIERIIKLTAEDLGEQGWDEFFGYGRINAFRALLMTHCPADLNSDGVLDSRDVIAFLNALSTNGLAADYNVDGTINSRDVIAFLNAFNRGCSAPRSRGSGGG